VVILTDLSSISLPETDLSLNDMKHFIYGKQTNPDGQAPLFPSLSVTDTSL